MTHPQQAESRIPKSWEWYGEAIKWFIAIAAALLAFGFDRAKEGELAGALWWGYVIGAALLGWCVMLGLYAYLQLLGAANLLEHHPLSNDQKTSLTNHSNRLAWAYQWCVGTLMLGVLVSTATWLWMLWPGSERAHAVPLAVERASPSGELFVVRRRGAITEVLTSGAGSSLVWARVMPARPPAPAAPAAGVPAPAAGETNHD